MARNRYGWTKRAKELARKQKSEEKRKRRQNRPQAPPGDGTGGGVGEEGDPSQALTAFRRKAHRVQESGPATLTKENNNMSIKMFVGNLPQEMTEDKLHALFSEAGHVVSAKIVKDRYTGQPRGFGFVEMETKLEGQKAISMINGRKVDGCTLAVNEARPPQKGLGHRGRGGYRR